MNALAQPVILIVDDNPANLTLLGELLLPQHAVRVANAGLRALRLARLRPQPGLILLDVMMPEMDGYEVLRQLRADPETAGIPVIFLTALTAPADAQRGLLLGAAAYVSKPVVPAQLLGLVRQHLQPAALGAAVPAGLAAGGQQGQGGQVWGERNAAQSAPVKPAALTVAGLTMSRALMYLPGRDQIFERALQQFTSQYRDGIAGLPAALSTLDWPQLGRLLHALRGACGAIGATELLARAGALEARLDRPAPRADHRQPEAGDAASLALQAWQIDSDLVALVNAILSALNRRPAQGAGSPAPVDPVALQDAMAALLSQLRTADFAAGEALRALAPPLQVAFGQAAVQPVAEALARHDYEGAALALHGLRQR